MFKVVIFDFDGVIADSLSYHFKKMVDIAKEDFGLKENDEKILNEIRSKSYFELMKTFKISWVKIPAILRLINQAQNEVYKNIGQIKIFPGIRELLMKLKKREVKLFILSSNLEKTINKFVKLNKIDFFNKVYCQTNLLGKASLMKKLIKENQLNKKDIVYIGDEIRDVEASKKVGIKVIGVSWGFQKSEVLKKHGADFIVKKPLDILKIILNLQST